MKRILLPAALLLPLFPPPRAEVKSLSVLGVRAGHTTRLEIYGENLDPREVTADRAGVGIKLLGVRATEGDAKAKGGRQVTIELTPNADTPRAAVILTLKQPDGSQATAQVPVVESVKEEIATKHPCDTYEKAMPLPGPSVAINGFLNPDSADVFRFEARAGQVWEFNLVAGRGGSALDPILRIRDRRHLPLALSAGLPKRDRHLVFRAPSDGFYYIEITEQEGKGGATFRYLLTALRKTP